MAITHHRFIISAMDKATGARVYVKQRTFTESRVPTMEFTSNGSDFGYVFTHDMEGFPNGLQASDIIQNTLQDHIEPYLDTHHFWSMEFVHR